MIVTIDGYDGTGKTTLAKNIAKEKNFIYIEKPFILKYFFEHNCSFEEAVKATMIEEKELYSNGSIQDKIKYYLDGIIWLNTIKDMTNIVLDRGVLTTYAVFGSRETEEIFKKYIDDGIAFDLSFYLIADDLERRRRIILNDPNDPDLKYPIKWRENNLEEFANENNVNYFKIQTDDISREDVSSLAIDYLEDSYDLKSSTIITGESLVKCLRKLK